MLCHLKFYVFAVIFHVAQSVAEGFYVHVYHIVYIVSTQLTWHYSVMVIRLALAHCVFS